MKNIRSQSVFGMLVVLAVVSLLQIKLCNCAPGRDMRHFREMEVTNPSFHDGGRLVAEGRQETNLQKLIRQMTGRWNNRLQMTEEATHPAAFLPLQRHPLFRATILQVAVSLFPSPQEVLFIQNDLYVGEGLQKTPNLMVLQNQDGGIRMKTYAFRDASMVVDKWQQPGVFSDLHQRDLVDLGSACQQQWLSQQDGGFLAWATLGECTMQMGELLVSLDIGTQSTESWMALKYNMFLPDGSPLMAWPEPFNFTRIPDQAYDDIMRALMEGDDIHYSLDLGSCWAKSQKGNSHHLQTDTSHHVQSSIISSLGVISGKLDHFKAVRMGKTEYLHFSATIDMVLLNRVSNVVLEFFYQQDEYVRVTLHDPANRDPLTMLCDSINYGSHNVFRVMDAPTTRTHLTNYSSLLSVARWGKQLRLVLDRPNEGCWLEQDEQLQGYGTLLKSFTTNSSEDWLRMTSSWTSYDLTSCHSGSELLNSLSVSMTRAEDTVHLHHGIIDLSTMDECSSTKITCSLSQTPSVPGIKLYVTGPI